MRCPSSSADQEEINKTPELLLTNIYGVDMDNITHLPPRQILREIYRNKPEKESDIQQQFDNIALQIVKQNEQAREAKKLLEGINAKI
jgi:hypothetical protein